MKSLCKLKKDDLKSILPTLARNAASSPYICKKCGRIAPEEKWLCKPVDIQQVAARAGAET